MQVTSKSTSILDYVYYFGVYMCSYDFSLTNCYFRPFVNIVKFWCIHVLVRFLVLEVLFYDLR